MPSSLQFATHTIRITDPDVCQVRLQFYMSNILNNILDTGLNIQVRLDLETFEVSGPSLTHYPVGECDLDR